MWNIIYNLHHFEYASIFLFTISCSENQELSFCWLSQKVVMKTPLTTKLASQRGGGVEGWGGGGQGWMEGHGGRWSGWKGYAKWKWLHPLCTCVLLFIFLEFLVSSKPQNIMYWVPAALEKSLKLRSVSRSWKNHWISWKVLEICKNGKIMEKSLNFGSVDHGKIIEFWNRLSTYMCKWICILHIHYLLKCYLTNQVGRLYKFS